MPKKCENICKPKDDRWKGRYILIYDKNGNAQYSYVYAEIYSEVKQKFCDKKSSTFQKPDMPSKSNVMYNDILNAWLQFKKLNIKESTLARYTHLIDTHIRPCLGECRLSKMSTQLVQEYIEKQLSEGHLHTGEALSPKTVTDILTIIKSTIEYVKYNNFNVACNLSKLTIKKKDKEMRVLCQAEQDALLRVLLHEMDLYKFGVLLSLYTGIRIGELSALQWENLSLSDATLKVRKTMQRIQDTSVGAKSKTKVIVTEPKSQCSIRDIPLPAFLVEIARQFLNHPKAYVLSGNQNKYVEPRTMQNRFRSYVEESGIDKANFHSLRHTFATRCVEVGFEIKSLSEILGHANVNITLNRYVHSSFELKCSNMNKLSLPV